MKDSLRKTKLKLHRIWTCSNKKIVVGFRCHNQFFMRYVIEEFIKSVFIFCLLVCFVCLFLFLGSSLSGRTDNLITVFFKHLTEEIYLCGGIYGALFRRERPWPPCEVQSHIVYFVYFHHDNAHMYKNNYFIICFCLWYCSLYWGFLLQYCSTCRTDYPTTCRTDYL
jgi:hypothetical protein